MVTSNPVGKAQGVMERGDVQGEVSRLSVRGTALGQAARQMRQFMCGLHGHDMLLHFDNRRVSLQCVACGYESPGWTGPGAAIGQEGARTGRSAGASIGR